MTFPCVYVLYPELAHPLRFSPFYLSPLLMVIPTGLNILYSFLNRKCITLIHLLNFLLLPSPQCDLFFILVLGCLGFCSLFSGIFVLVLYLHKCT
jgi:hypothetical protein